MVVSSLAVWTLPIAIRLLLTKVLHRCATVLVTDSTKEVSSYGIRAQDHREWLAVSNNQVVTWLVTRCNRM